MEEAKMKLSDLRTAAEVHEQNMLDPEYRREWERSRQKEIAGELPPEITAAVDEGRGHPERRTPYRRRTPRRAGSPWRILVHEDAGDRRSYDVSNDPGKPAKRAETMRQLNAIRPDMPDVPDHTECTVLEGTEFDELVIGKWIHLEQMDTGKWWMNVGGVTVNISIDRDGRPKRVDVYGPGDYAEPEKGCAYNVAWSAGDPQD